MLFYLAMNNYLTHSWFMLANVSALCLAKDVLNLEV